MIYDIFCLLSIPLVLISLAMFIAHREGTGPDWFIKFQEHRIGAIVVLLAGIIVLFSIFFSFSPDSFWD